MSTPDESTRRSGHFPQSEGSLDGNPMSQPLDCETLVRTRGSLFSFPSGIGAAVAGLAESWCSAFRLLGFISSIEFSSAERLANTRVEQPVACATLAGRSRRPVSGFVKSSGHWPMMETQHQGQEPRHAWQHLSDYLSAEHPSGGCMCTMVRSPYVGCGNGPLTRNVVS